MTRSPRGAPPIDRMNSLDDLMLALALGMPDAPDRGAALALRAQLSDNCELAAAAAGTVVLFEHLQSAGYRHSKRMLGVLSAIGPDSGADTEIGLMAWAGAAVAHDYGVLPAWTQPPLARLLERASHASADKVLALACALAEVCERNGRDAEFSLIEAQVATVKHASAAAFWRGHWAIVAAWHLCAFAKIGAAREHLAHARALAQQSALPQLTSAVDMQRARLIEWRLRPEVACALADDAVRGSTPAETPLRFADQADVHCRAAMRRQDFHAALGHARRAIGYLQLSEAWPAYQATYRVNEAYALIGVGAAEQAQLRLRAVAELGLPAYLVARVRCLADLAALISTEALEPMQADGLAALAATLRRLRELEWPGVLEMLPLQIGRIFALALGYRIEVDWVRAAIRTRDLPAPPRAPESWPWRVRVRTFGGFSVLAESGPLAGPAGEPRKAAAKPLELLRFLAAGGTDAVAADTVAQALWPGDGREGRRKALEVTVARLRRLLDCDEAVVVHDLTLRLNAERVWTDTRALGEQLEWVEADLPDHAAARHATARAVALYRGACLADSAQPWALAAAERWRIMLSASMLRVSRMDGVSPSEGLEWRLRVTAADPMARRYLEPAAPDQGEGIVPKNLNA